MNSPEAGEVLRWRLMRPTYRYFELADGFTDAVAPAGNLLAGPHLPSGVLAGNLMTIGARRVTVDLSIADLKTPEGKTEENQRIYIPVVVGLSTMAGISCRPERPGTRRAAASYPPTSATTS